MSEKDSTKTQSFQIWVFTSDNVKTNICTCKQNSKGTHFPASVSTTARKTAQAKAILHLQASLNTAFSCPKGISQLP